MREPDFEGPAGKAWKASADGDAVPEWQRDAFMGGYLVFAPQAHPWWSYHVVTGIHLRSSPGEPNPPHVRFPGATHEILCVALDPEHDSELDPDDTTTFHYLTPPDAEVQVILGDDEQAREMVRLAAVACVHGTLVPDSDWRTAWSGVLAQTAEHLRLGEHPEEP